MPFYGYNRPGAKVSEGVRVSFWLQGMMAGMPAALGGLIKDTRDNERSGIPILSDLPLIGPLFRTTTKSRGRTELLVLLTPSVVRSPEEARRVTDELRERLQNVRALGYRVR
jgi:general secretion pathway protein D